jgi:soluble lytic murein transglycosylase-like protein
MQIMYSTAKLYIQKDEQLTKKLLKTDIDLNVRLSMRILRDLKDTYGTWGKALGAYNTGKPVVNKYAKNILKKSYNWILANNYKIGFATANIAQAVNIIEWSETKFHDLTMLEFTIDHGYTYSSAFAFCMYGILLINSGNYKKVSL